MNSRESIEKTKQGFEESFRVDSYYNKQTRDDSHLQRIMEHLQVKEGMKILDLGTGTGYLSFPLAAMHRKAEVVGLDIVEKTLEENQRRAAEEGLSNLRFVSYDGIKFPFADEFFDIIITRYALHHFPTIEKSFQEISRVLKKDGHIKFYTKNEWKDIGKQAQLEYIEGFETSIRFPRQRKTALEFDNIISRHDEAVIKGYDVEVTEDEIWITEKVNNLFFWKVS